MIYYNLVLPKGGSTDVGEFSVNDFADSNTVPASGQPCPPRLASKPGNGRCFASGCMKSTKAKSPSRAQVAEAAGVSPATVSYVLHDTPGASISEPTRHRVRQAAQRLGYQPNFAGASLVRGRTDIFGLLMPQMSPTDISWYSQMVAALTEAASESPYYFLYLNDHHPEKYETALRRGYLDGLVLLRSNEYPERINAVKAFDRPVVTLNHLNTCGVHSVTHDLEQCAETFCNFLLERGCRRPAMFFHSGGQGQQRLRQRCREMFQQADGPEITWRKSDEHGSLAQTIEAVTAQGEHDALVVTMVGCLTDEDLDAHFEAGVQRAGKRPMLIVLTEDVNRPPARSADLVLEAQPRQLGQCAFQTLSDLVDGKTRPQRQQIVFEPHVRG